jgi:hypothetical protein
MAEPKLMVWNTDPTAVNPYASADDYTTAKTVAEALNRHYPGHLWEVSVPENQGVVQIFDQCMNSWGADQGGRVGVIIKKSDYATSSELERLAMRYCGELLERFNVARGRLRMDQYLALPTDFAGRHAFQK